jgi:hypothetical protein
MSNDTLREIIAQAMRLAAEALAEIGAADRAAKAGNSNGALGGASAAAPLLEQAATLANAACVLARRAKTASTDDAA